MPTPAIIAIRPSTQALYGSAVSIDGGLGQTGLTLLGHYLEREKITALVKLGDLRFLKSEIGEARDFVNTKRTKANESWSVAVIRDQINHQEFDDAELAADGEPTKAETIAAHSFRKLSADGTSPADLFEANPAAIWAYVYDVATSAWMFAHQSDSVWHELTVEATQPIAASRKKAA